MAMLATRERPAALDFAWPPSEDELDALEVIDLRGPAPAASQPVIVEAMWRTRVPRLAAISAMLLFAMSIGLLLGVRDARRSMTAGITHLRESVVAVHEYVEHVGTAPSTTARVTPTRPASTPVRPRIVAVSPSIAATPTAIAASPLAADPVAAEPVAEEPVAPLPQIDLSNAMNTVSALSTVTTLASPAPHAAATAIVGIAAVEARVKQALARYRQAYDTLDAQAVAASWPSVDFAALTRAFDNLRSQSLTFDRCAIDVASTSTATASCTGSTTAVRQVGSATPVTRSLQWTFNLRRGVDDAWVIDTVRTTRP